MMELGPLAAADLPPSVARILASAPQARVMAAKGLSPLRPGELLVAVFQLSFDADEKVKQAADAAPVALPDKLVVAALAEPLPAGVLHFFATRLPVSRSEALARILYNRFTADDTYAALAGRVAERELDIIVQNEERYLRHPAIVEALFHNKNAAMSSVNRVIELCVRNGVRVDGIPAFDEIAKSIGADPKATSPEADAVFQAAMAEADSVVAAVGGEEAAVDAGLSEEAELPPEALAPDAGKKGSKTIDFTKLKLHEKIRLATLGNAYCRSVLMRDANKMVAMAAVKSPQITDNEIVKVSGNRAVAEEVIRYIANQREFVKMYQVKVNLINNPKTPLPTSLRLLSFLHAEDLKRLSRSRNIPSALSTTAKKLVQQRGLT